MTNVGRSAGLKKERRNVPDFSLNLILSSMKAVLPENCRFATTIARMGFRLTFRVIGIVTKGRPRAESSAMLWRLRRVDGIDSRVASSASKARRLGETLLHVMGSRIMVS